MNVAAHHYLLGGNKRRPLYRYMKLIVPNTGGMDGNTNYQFNVQISKLDLVNQADQYFSYPSATSFTLSKVYRRNNGEDPPMLLRHSVRYKWCSCISDGVNPPLNYPVTVVFDFKSAILDTNIYDRWWVYTSNDTRNNPGRNPSIDLFFSVDGVVYDLADSVTYNEFPAANNTRAFVRKLFENI